MRSARIALIVFFLAACGKGMLTSRVEGSLDSSSLAAAQGPLHVTVVGTTLATSTDANGRFTIDGVPPGEVVLHFTGNGVDVTVTLAGLVAGQTLQVTLHINGKEAQVVTPAPDLIRLAGSISAVGTKSITVSGIMVETDANTKFVQNEAAIHFSDLKTGDIVRIEGTLQAGGKVLARKIQRFVPPDFNQVTLTGDIEKITAPDFIISGLTIATDANTKFAGGAKSFADLVMGDRVRVRGTLRADGSVLASKVVKGEEEENEDEVELDGAIATITPPDTFTVGNTKVVVNAATRIEAHEEEQHGGDERLLSFADLKVGDQVHVEGTARADGSLLAAEIEVGAREHH